MKPRWRYAYISNISNYCDAHIPSINRIARNLLKGLISYINRIIKGYLAISYISTPNIWMSRSISNKLGIKWQSFTPFGYSHID